ncbi:putative manganese-dependent inorganic pyrophosphatase [Methanosarcina horonobensis HB-1 = JCM 15518]|uniref:Putative manganese-dependent inorganic pyrophosphatase n=1 Tax=Methanosarcina horonobensis HB-1 = JCM 15518 TaxID=1434110 RepID=A0A0E3S6Z0_9EURY|nr:putative manganese-dependent inorganic pyrophosphatase [Methanosarcina horonobensis HB-1 = JCM 15518]
MFILAKSFTQGKTSGKKGNDNEEPEKNFRKGNEFSEAVQGSSQGSEAFFESIVRGSEGCLWMTIEELMTRDPVTVNEDTPTEEVFSVFAKNPYHTLPVVNKKGELAGVIDLDIILEVLLLCLMPRERHTPLTARRSLGENAKEIMITHPVTISLKSTLKDASDLMMKHRFDQICVSEAGKLVGILSKRDLVEEICRRRKKEGKKEDAGL